MLNHNGCLVISAVCWQDAALPTQLTEKKDCGSTTSLEEEGKERKGKNDKRLIERDSGKVTYPLAVWLPLCPADCRKRERDRAVRKQYLIWRNSTWNTAPIGFLSIMSGICSGVIRDRACFIRYKIKSLSTWMHLKANESQMWPVRIRLHYNKTLLHLFRTRLLDQSLRPEKHPAEPAYDAEQLSALIKMYTLHTQGKFNMRQLTLTKTLN